MQISFNVWDVGGQHKIRPLWRYYFTGTDALIWVVDSSDTERMEEAAEELASLMREEDLKDATLLVFANKQDLPNALSCAEITEKLHLSSLGSRKWFVQSTVASNGEGLYEGLDWLSRSLKR